MDTRHLPKDNFARYYRANRETSIKIISLYKMALTLKKLHIALNRDCIVINLSLNFIIFSFQIKCH